MKLIFCMQINIKVHHRLVSTLWASKFPTRRYTIITAGHDKTFSIYSKQQVSNTFINSQNHMSSSLHLCYLCSKLMFFKRSRVYCSKSNYAHKISQKKLVLGPVIQIIPPKVFTNVPPYCNRKSTSSAQCENQLDTHLSRSVLSIWLYSFFNLSAMQDLWIISFFCFPSP